MPVSAVGFEALNDSVGLVVGAHERLPYIGGLRSGMQGICQRMRAYLRPSRLSIESHQKGSR